MEDPVVTGILAIMNTPGSIHHATTTVSRIRETKAGIQLMNRVAGCPMMVNPGKVIMTMTRAQGPVSETISTRILATLETADIHLRNSTLRMTTIAGSTTRMSNMTPAGTVPLIEILTLAGDPETITCRLTTREWMVVDQLRRMIGTVNKMELPLGVPIVTTSHRSSFRIKPPTTLTV